MDHSPVVIIGAGPSGLALGVGLAKLGVKSTVLEREPNITEDPRGIVLMGDAVRIATRLGIGEDLCSTAGHAMKRLSFHRGSLGTPAFMPQNIDRDFNLQCCPECIAHCQPLMEQSLRRRAAESGLCDVRSGCEVIHVEEDLEEPVVVFREKLGAEQKIKCSWLVGADGKKGLLRKRYLEKYGIRQEVGLFRYEGTWIAANLDITIPTPESHPEFPLWKAGFTPDDVMREFWPEGFHFLNDTNRPQVGGRFGPLTSFFWRYEFAVDSADDLNHSEEQFWKLFRPQIRRSWKKLGLNPEDGSVDFPNNCIRLMRCRPFKFAALVANKWYHERMILIGDAAHVFPPFGGQGIASGFRDADSLAWRLALLLQTDARRSKCQEHLSLWHSERRYGVDEALRITARNGEIVNERSQLRANLRGTLIGLLYSSEVIGNMVTDSLYRREESLAGCAKGFFLPEMGGGIKLAQVWIQRGNTKPMLSDQVFFSGDSIFSMLAIHDDICTPDDVQNTEVLLQKAQLPVQLLSSSSIHHVSRKPSGRSTQPGWTVCSSATLRMHSIQPQELYEPATFFSRLGPRKKYVLVRPDSYAYCVTTTSSQLERSLTRLKEATAVS